MNMGIELRIGDAICFNDYRLDGKKNYAVWQSIAKTPIYTQGKKERFKVERTFGEQVNNLGISDCRYFGKIKTEIQMFMTSICYNIKKFIKITEGTSPKQPAYCFAT